MRTQDEQHTPEDMPAKHGGHAEHERTVRRARRARGGGTPVHVFPKDSPEADEAAKEEDEFKRGGKAKKTKRGGHAEGEMAHMRPDRPSRSKRKAGGHAHESEHTGHHQVEHEGHGGHAHGPHHASTHHEGPHEAAVHHTGPHGPALHHHGEGDIHLHRARGGRASGGHSPFSSGHKGVPRDDNPSPAARGYEGLKVPDAPD